MSPVLIISLGCLVAVTAPAARADVYQCTRNGQVTFSDIPCSSDAKPLPLNIYTPSPEEVERATRQTREIEENLASGQKQRQIILSYSTGFEPMTCQNLRAVSASFYGKIPSIRLPYFRHISMMSARKSRTGLDASTSHCRRLTITRAAISRLSAARRLVR